MELLFHVWVFILKLPESPLDFKFFKIFYQELSYLFPVFNKVCNLLHTLLGLFSRIDQIELISDSFKLIDVLES
jgi:hypothetical protein